MTAAEKEARKTARQVERLRLALLAEIDRQDREGLPA